MKRALGLLLVPFFAQAAEHDHSAHTAPVPAPAATHDHSAPIAEPAPVDHSAHTTAAQPAAPVVAVQPPPELAASHAHMMAEHGASLNFLLIGERFEQSDEDTQAWELQGWLGYDRDKLWLKTEGEYDTKAHATEHSEVQLLYSRAIAPYWDLQAGLRRDDAGSSTRTHAVIGLMGLAPYWFELDAAAFISEDGELSTRFEAEYELRFTQKLLLQPRVELNYSFADAPAFAVGEGVSEVVLGLRLRYELRREFAPYLGVEWSRSFAGTATLLRATGRDREDTQIVAGLRFWY